MLANVTALCFNVSEYPHPSRIQSTTGRRVVCVDIRRRAPMREEDVSRRFIIVATALLRDYEWRRQMCDSTSYYVVIFLSVWCIRDVVSPCLDTIDAIERVGGVPYSIQLFDHYYFVSCSLFTLDSSSNSTGEETNLIIEESSDDETDTTFISEIPTISQEEIVYEEDIPAVRISMMISLDYITYLAIGISTDGFYGTIIGGCWQCRRRKHG